MTERLWLTGEAAGAGVRAAGAGEGPVGHRESAGVGGEGAGRRDAVLGVGIGVGLCEGAAGDLRVRDADGAREAWVVRERAAAAELEVAVGIGCGSLRQVGCDADDLAIGIGEAARIRACDRAVRLRGGRSLRGKGAASAGDGVGRAGERFAISGEGSGDGKCAAADCARKSQVVLRVGVPGDLDERGWSDAGVRRDGVKGAGDSRG